MTALGPCDHAVGAHHHVAVKVHVHLQGSQDHEIQLVDEGSLIERVGILRGGDLNVVRVPLNGLDGSQIEILGIHDLFDQALFQKLTHGGGDASQAQAHVDPPLLHDLSQGNGGGDGGSAHAGLVGKALFKIRCVDHKLGTVVRHHDLSHIGGGLCRSSGDLCRISDLVHHAHIVHMDHGDAGGNVGEGDQAVGEGDHLVGIFRIHHGVG